MKRHSVEKTRRQYNRLVATETLEDYALRYAPSSFRKWSPLLLANTAIGSISFLALEAIGATLLLSFGYTNAVWAIVLASIVIFVAGLPISYYAARYNIDIDLLTRSAGFGYVGSTITSLIYASFCFIFFALEAAIMAQALQLYFELPLYLGYILCSLVIIPVVFYGITAINRLHLWTQPLWLILMLTPFYFVLTRTPHALEALTYFQGRISGNNEFDPYYFGIATGISLSLIAQIGEQVDYLRFMPDKHKGNRVLWWSSMLAAGPGWVVLGGVKQLAGVLLASIAVLTGLTYVEAKEPVQMYYAAYTYVFDHPSLALLVSTVFVVISQIKINVTNAYAGSLAWSNFFSRVTHAHPGRVVWLVFNIGIALLLMELGVFDALQKVLGLYSNFAIAWIAVVVADLTINKPLKLSPPVIEFKRAHLYDYNPVGVVSMVIAVLSSTLAFTGLLGLYAQAYSWLIALVTAFALTPLIAMVTKGKYYIARQNVHFAHSDELGLCGVCDQHYAQTDFAYCAFYDVPICSLCCTLDSNCKDQCKPRHTSLFEQAALHVLGVIFKHRLSTQVSVRITRFAQMSGAMLGIVGLTFWLTYSITNDPLTPQFVAALNANLFNLFFVLAVLICILAWWIVLGHESQGLAETELEEQNQRLDIEITERKRAEEVLKESEMFHRAVLDATPDAMFLSDEQGIITQVNQQAECLLGYQAGEIIGQSIDILLPERLRSGHKVLFAKFTDSPVARPMSLGMNVPALRKDGSEVNVEISLSPIQTKRGLIIASALRDVTQRKQMEDTLRASEERFRRMANASPAMIWVTDVSGNPIFVNRTWLDFTGVEFKDAMTYEGWTRVIHPDDRESVFLTYYDNIHRDEPILSEYRLRHADGDWCWILDKGVPLYNETGMFSGYIGSAIDITERKRAVETLISKELFLRTIYENVQAAIFVVEVGVTGEFQYTGWNSAGEALTGIKSDHTIGRSPVEVFGPIVGKRICDNYTKCVNEGTYTYEECFASDRGDTWSLTTLTVMKDAAGRAFHIIGFATDITKRRHAEAELRVAAVAFESQESMIITDVDGVILRVNRAFTESTGYKAEEVLGQTPRLFKSGRHDDAFYAAMWESINHTGTWQGEIWDRRKNGEIYPKWLTITAVKDVAGVITHYVGTHIDITERKATENEIKQLAFYDPLTQLPNRRLLQERLKHAINMERRDGKQLGLLMLDLDRFKAVNDSLGHLAGDELLQQAAARITARLRDVDMVARLGGDEFIVLLEDIALPEDAARVAEEIIADLTKPFCLTQSDDVQIGASIGISLYPQHGDSPELLMDHADAALYQAKDAGRGCFAYFSEDLTRVAKERIALESRLRHALEQQELRVFFQPQVDIASGRIVGAEALVRWQDPVEGLILPYRFIPIAEETGLIVEIGAWVLRETCRQGRLWLDAGLPPLTLAVNVSAHQFRRSDFCALVATVLSDTGFPPEQLELEITESGLMGKLVEDTATALLNRLRAQGIRLAIDDFGTGYSSLAYLKHFPLDVLKIDKSFIDDIPFQQDDMEIAATVVAMGHILGFKVLAEGVETSEQLAFLQLKGCDSYQGFIKSKAVPAQEFVELLRDQLHSSD